MCGGGGSFIGGLISGIIGFAITGTPIGFAGGFAGGMIGGVPGAVISAATSFGAGGLADMLAGQVTNVPLQAGTESVVNSVVSGATTASIDEAVKQAATITTQDLTQAVAEQATSSLADQVFSESMKNLTSGFLQDGGSILAETAGSGLGTATAGQGLDTLGTEVAQQGADAALQQGAAEAAGYTSREAQLANTILEGGKANAYGLSEVAYTPDGSMYSPDSIAASEGVAASAGESPSWALNEQALETVGPAYDPLGTGTGPGLEAGVNNRLGQLEVLARGVGEQGTLASTQTALDQALAEGTITAAQHADMLSTAQYGDLTGLREAGGSSLASSLSAGYPNAPTSVLGAYGGPGGMLSSAEADAVKTPIGELAKQLGSGMKQFAADGTLEYTALGNVSRVVNAGLPIAKAAVANAAGPIPGMLVGALDIGQANLLPQDPNTLSTTSITQTQKGIENAVALAQGSTPTIAQSVGAVDLQSLWKRAPGLAQNATTAPEEKKPKKVDTYNPWTDAYDGNGLFRQLATFSG